MKQKYLIWLLCAVVAVSVLANVVLARASFGYFDESYGQMAKQHLINSTVRSQLEQGNVAVAKALLDREIETTGSLLAICLMEACSSSAAEMMSSSEEL